MTRMFQIPTQDGLRPMRTWSPFTGCNFNCTYYWARELVEGRLHHLARYKGGFMPTTHPDRFTPRFKPGDFVFVCDMGDIAFAPAAVWSAILDAVGCHPNTKFLLQSKDPRVFPHLVPDNVYLGTTLESNVDYEVSLAPSPFIRCRDLRNVEHPHKFISIEPIMDFDLETLVRWIKDVRPEIVEVGADNYHNDLPEPPWGKVQQLLEALRGFVPHVIEKDGLARLRV